MLYVMLYVICYVLYVMLCYVTLRLFRKCCAMTIIMWPYDTWSAWGDKELGEFWGRIFSP